MTPSLPLFLAAPLVAALMGAPLIGATSDLPDRPVRIHTGGAAPEFKKVPPVGDVVRHTAAAAPGGYWTPERQARALPINLLSVVGQLSALATRVLPAPVTPGRALPESTEPDSTELTRAKPDRAMSGSAAPNRAMPQRAARRRQAASSGMTSGSPWVDGGVVRKTTGRVFLTMKGLDFVCSASAVRSANKDVVVTAGHCVKDGTGSWAENWTFVPGYEAGREPYGSYPARQMLVAGPWSRSADDNYDVGMVVVNSRDGRHLTDAVGAQRIGFNTERGLPIHGFGFPADPPYDGEHLQYCAGPVHGDPYDQTRDQGLRCDLTAGASGGPWLTGFDRATGLGTVTSVSSFKYSNDRGTMYGPYFGDAAKELFEAAERA